jgi:hypothetical protein
VTNSENACALRIQSHQDDSRRLAEFVAHQASESPPLLAWAEPDPLYVDRFNRTGRRGDFMPLVRGVRRDYSQLRRQVSPDGKHWQPLANKISHKR